MRRDLERVLHGRSYTSILVLSGEEEDVELADSRVLTTLLLVRDIRKRNNLSVANSPVVKLPPPPGVKAEPTPTANGHGFPPRAELQRRSASDGVGPARELTLIGEVLGCETRDLVMAAGISADQVSATPPPRREGPHPA